MTSRCIISRCMSSRGFMSPRGTGGAMCGCGAIRCEDIVGGPSNECGMWWGGALKGDENTGM